MNKTICSITTLPYRQNNCGNLIETLLNQKDFDIECILYFQGSKNELCSDIYNLTYQYKNFYIEFISDTFRSYSKYIYVLNSFKDYNILLCDDDVIIDYEHMLKYKNYIEDTTETYYSTNIKEIIYRNNLIYQSNYLIYNSGIRSRFYTSESGHLTFYPKGFFSNNFIQDNYRYLFDNFPTSDEFGLLVHNLLYKKYIQNIIIDNFPKTYKFNFQHTLFSKNRFNYFKYTKILKNVLDNFKFDWKEFEIEYFKEKDELNFKYGREFN